MSLTLENVHSTFTTIVVVWIGPRQLSQQVSESQILARRNWKASICDFVSVTILSTSSAYPNYDNCRKSAVTIVSTQNRLRKLSQDKCIIDKCISVGRPVIEPCAPY